MSEVRDVGRELDGNGVVDVIVVDDHRLFRDGLVQLLSTDRRFRVAGRAASGEEFLELDILQGPSAKTESGDKRGPVVFMDIDMPGMGGVEATRRATERWPGMRIVALSMHGEQEFYLPMVEAGAKGFLLKSSEFAQVAEAALRVAAGGTYFSPELMEALMEAMEQSGGHADSHTDNHPGATTWKEPLSERETEILPLVCQGLANHEIADRLFISKRTVDKHRANILAKTGCRNTASLVLYAVKNNLIKI
ncbi:MAG: response regulator transcription factor [Alistipes sp.]|jgi:DNA-binding NarL/FixJ family response regulator|nr:response regulator transcription factor [Alistipes sp.]